MTAIASTKDKLAGLARAEELGYSGETGEKLPLAGYTGAMAVYGTAVATIAGLARITGRDMPDGFDLRQVALTAAAAYKLSRLVAKDPVTSPLRAPFTVYRGTEGPAELREDVRGTGARKAVGEFITCPFCISLWAATGMTAGLIFAPRATRAAIGTLAAVAGADALQYAHAWLAKATS